MSLAATLIPKFLQRPYRDIQKRLDKLEEGVRCLEMALDALIVDPKYVPGERVGFNGQLKRKEIFTDLVNKLQFDCIVETGTWLGNTTAYMAQTSRLPVYSCELSPRFHALARMRLAGVTGVNLEQGDCRQFLQKLSQGDTARKRVFFYLDAHWYDQVPLPEEISTIASHWKEFVVLVDDFEVPGDPGYGYDICGNPRVSLDLKLLREPVHRHGLKAYFPAARSQEETGARRGCVVLAQEGATTRVLDALPSLRVTSNASVGVQ